MFPRTMNAFICILITLLLLGTIGATFGDYYSSSYKWGFQNNCYFGFKTAMNFTDTPNQGLPYDSSIVGYWNMNEGSGTVAQDSSGNGNSGTLVNSATWVTGKFGNALNFGGVNDSVNFGNSSTFSSAEVFTVSMWLNFEPLSVYGYVLAKAGSYIVYADENGRLSWWVYTTSGNYNMGSVGKYADGNWHLVACTFDSTLSNQQMKIYVDGVLSNSHNLNGTIANTQNNLFSGAYEGSWRPFKGAIDDVRIYNRTLSTAEVAAMYSQPDPNSFANYYSYKDPITNNTIVVDVESSNTNISKVALVTCTEFFASNKLAFQANNSVTVNVWTNLGQPAFTSGVWNSQNYTTTLTLDASYTAELNWNTYDIATYIDTHSSVSPSNVTVGLGESQTFNFNATQGYRFNVAVDGVSQGQINSLTFSNITATHSINVTSALLNYTVAASTDLGSTIAPSGDISVNYGGSQVFTIQNKPGYIVKHVYVDNVDKGTVSNYTFSNVKENHVISVSSQSLSSNSSTPTPTPSPTPTSSQTSESTNSPSSTPTSRLETNQFPTQTALIGVVAVFVVVAILALAFKKGFITVEVFDEEEQKETSQDFSI
jgi:hypothetical protein